MEPKHKRYIRIGAYGVICFLLVTISVMYFGAKFRIFGSPFTRNMDWVLGLQEQSFNFGEVVPGKLYRSEKPDKRFVQYVYDKYNIRHIISFTGNEKSHDMAEKLGMNVIAYDWSQNRLPSDEEIFEVIDYITKHDGVLVHCGAGSDRTGYLVAFYRIQQQHWDQERAINEMGKYGYDPKKKKKLHSAIKEWAKRNA